ncbi:MAG: alpha-amylase family protein [Acidobacteriota bacterium]
MHFQQYPSNLFCLIGIIISLVYIPAANAMPTVLCYLQSPSPLTKSSTEISEKAVQPNTQSLQFSIGNLSVPLLLKKWGSPLLDKGVDATKAGHKKELDDFIKASKTVGTDKIEDYLGWAVVEPKKGKWQWKIYKEDANTIISNGIKYVPYVWMQNLPHWVRYNPSYPHASCVEHEQESETLSIFSPKTMQLYDRFFAELRKQLGTQIDLLRIGAPSDFGEASYPVGVATFAFPDKHIHPGFWVNEEDARVHFKETMRLKYNVIENLNRAWETSFNSFDNLEYPQNAFHRRWWLDFVNWYHEAHTDKLAELVDVVLKHFPNTPINLNFGFPDERIIYGQDITGLMKKMAERDLQLRTPTGPVVPFFNTKRIATAAHFYHLAGFSSEPADGEASTGDIASAVFKDLTTGVTLHFDYVDNMLRGKSSIDQGRQLYQGKYPEIDSAIFFSTTAHRLDDSQREQAFKGYPDNLVPFTEELRDIIDYDVVDEQLISDGALAQYRVIIVPLGMLTEANTLSKLRNWVEDGGILILLNLADISTVEGDRGAFADLTNNLDAATAIGKGFIYNAKSDLNKLAQIIATRPYAQIGNLSSVLLPSLDVALDKVLISYFQDGVMLFNRSDTTVTKRLMMPSGLWKVNYTNLPSQIELPPLAIRWIDGKTGNVH